MAYTAEKRQVRTINTRIYAPSPDDEIVISGISGKFPNSKNLAEFSHNLYNKVDMVDEKEKRWPNYHSEIPARMGTIDGLEKFDATFFGVPYKQTNVMDPQCRLLIETAYEAILDAGICPKSLRGSKTGVYIGACFVETEKLFFYDQLTPSGLGITGCSRAMLANRVSYCLGLCGPSFLIDTACSSSMYALDVAFSAIRNGECDAALVGGSNLLLHPYTTLQFARLGVIAKDGFCRPFDHKASGYTRSEAICVVYLQKAKNAKRIYANVIYSKTNCDGYKEEGITYPSGSMQQELLSEFYVDVGIDPNTLAYVEAHSTGTVVGDPEECKALDNVFCQNRSDALLVGSVKSNIGHTESCSGACSIAKVILAFENELIPPNLNFEAIKGDIPALAERRMIVCDDPTPFKSDKIAINSFGFGGANAHALFSRNEKQKLRNGAPLDDLPRLVNWAGRTEEAVNHVLNELETKPLDAELIGLMHSIQSEETPGYIYRGYTVLAKNREEPKGSALSLVRSTKHVDGTKRPIVWLFSGMGSQWTGMGSALMVFPQFREAIELCHNTLKPYGIDLVSVITSNDERVFKHIINSFVGIAAVQIGLVNILRVLEIPMDCCIGHSVGELGCAYADGTLTAEQMILAAYARGLVSYETKVIHGSMAAVGLSYSKIIDRLPEPIEVACHNSEESATISGPEADVSQFVAELKSQGVFAKEVACSNIAYHSRYIADMGPKLLKKLHEIIPNPVRRSAKWLSSSVPKPEWHLEENQYSSAEYHTNNLLHAVLFEETSALLPKDAITIEIAPHGLLQAIVKKSMPHAVHIPLTQRGHSNNAVYLLSAVGNIFLNNHSMPIERLYPAIEFPVSRGTPNISSLIKWDHHEDWFVMKFATQKACKSGERKVTVSLDESSYISGHVIDGRCIFPATAYLELVWETLAMITTGSIYSTINVEFEDIRFLRATSMVPGQNVDLTIMIHYGSGQFEITENGVTVVSGCVRVINTNTLDEDDDDADAIPIDDYPVLEQKEFYKELRLRGYHYNGLFRGVEEARGDGLRAKVKWNDNWPAFMDALLQLAIVAKDSRSLYLPTRIRKIRVDAMKHTRLLSERSQLDAIYDPELKLIKCGGVEIYGMVASSIVRRKAPGLEVLDSYRFLPLMSSETLSLSDGVRVITQLILENAAVTSKLSIVEVDNAALEPLVPLFGDAISETPLIKGELQLLTDRVLNLESVNMKNERISKLPKTHLLTIGANVLNNVIREGETLRSVGQNSFLLSRQFGSTSFTNVPQGFALITAVPTEKETLVLLRCKPAPSAAVAPKPTVIEVLSQEFTFEWVETLRASIKRGPVLLVAQNDPYPGLLGLVNCLRREPGGHNVRCVVIADRMAPKFSLEGALYRTQLEAGLTINVYRNTVWGTYRFVKLRQHLQETPRTGHFYANVQRLGDLSSFDWFTGNLSSSAPADGLVNIHYSSINFRDVMLATGRLPPEICGESRTSHECLLGLEYSGVNVKGDRVMGMVAVGAMATQVEAVENLTWKVPKDLSLRDAATIPAVYITIYYAFFFHRPIAKGNTILIHAGSGGIGLAAIRVALAYGLQVFTTVSTEQKRKFILSLFPQLKSQNIGNSRDCSFEEMVMHRTRGRGVDFVLNSLADDKLLASVRCLARGGTFLEIGKFDIMNNTGLGMGAFARETTFRAVFADNLIHMPDERKIIYELIDKDLRTGIIQPLHSTVFHVNDIESAYRYLSTGKHVGKVMIQVRENELSIASVPIKASPKVYCNSNLVYIVAGGLGGFGIELADWLVLRGARVLTLNSRRGVTNSYQSFRIKIWESYGCKVIISNADITTYQGCKNLLVDSLAHGQIGGIFNLAAVLRDSILENQNVSKFQECVAPKAVATRYLNELSRILCPQLQHFVVFSSASCGRGNAGQSNYGFANSIMERIIEQRVQDKLPGKAIQWGAIGEVGLVAEMAGDKIDVEVAGTLQQRIASCLNVLDVLLTVPQAVVSSVVVADKNGGDVTHDSQLSLIKSVMKIMGIRDIKTISTNTSLAELGMDSLMSVEIKQMLEREFDIFLTAQELRAITFGKFQEMSNASHSSHSSHSAKEVESKNAWFRNFGDELTSDLPVVKINKQNEKNDQPCAVIIPGIEGVAGNVWYSFGAKLTIPSNLIQMMNSMEATTINDIADATLETVRKCFANQKQFYIIGFSFGSLVAIRLAQLLEQTGAIGRVLLIDGAPVYLKRLETAITKSTSKDENTEDVLIMLTFYNLCSGEQTDKFTAQLQECDSWAKKTELLHGYLPDAIKSAYSTQYLNRVLTAMSNRLKAVTKLNGNSDAADQIVKLQSPVTLIRPTQASFTDIADDYELSKLAARPIDVRYVQGNHLSMLDSEEITQIIDAFAPTEDSTAS